jgi:hypothetical protein
MSRTRSPSSRGIRLLIERDADPVGAGDLHDLDVIGWATAFDYLDAPAVEVSEALGEIRES